jgi:hypothetical protein
MSHISVGLSVLVSPTELQAPYGEGGHTLDHPEDGAQRGLVSEDLGPWCLMSIQDRQIDPRGITSLLTVSTSFRNGLATTTP